MSSNLIVNNIEVGTGATVYTAASSTLTFGTNGAEKLRIGPAGQIGIVGANYGSSGQVLTSGGSGGAISWSTISTPDADKITEGNTTAEVVDTGSDGHFKVTTEGTERVRITGDGLGINVTPGRELHVKGADAIIRVESTYATGRNTIEFQDTSAQKGYIGYPSSSNDHFCIGQNDSADVYVTTAGTEKLRITSAGKLGLGVASPASESGWGNILHINSASAGAHIRFTDNTSGSGAGDGSYIGHYGNDTYLVNKESSGVIIFNTNANERLRIASSGQIGIGGANYGSSGQVLTSQGSGAAPQWATVSGGATETVGTWTPTLARVTGGAISGSYTTQFARYVKIGKLVNIELEIVLASVSSQGTGRPYITGLPFAPNREWSGNGNIMTFTIMQYNLNSGMIFASTTNSNCILIKEGAGADQTVMGDGGQTASLYNWKAGKIIANLIYQTA